jgi:hypothetical protein
VHVRHSSILYSSFLFAFSSIGFAHDPVCKNGDWRIPVQYQFIDQSYQQDWIYYSLQPKLIVGNEETSPTRTDAIDGALQVTFCATKTIVRSAFQVQFGPRKFLIAPRPIAPRTDSADSVTPVYLVNQPDPDWVIVRSRKEIAIVGATLPAFEIELMNFGKPRRGPNVTLFVTHPPVSCAAPMSPVTVPIEMVISGKRLSVASSDPEFPTDLVRRMTEIDLKGCNGYRLTISLGTMGEIPEGPFRIRYVIHEALTSGWPRSPSGDATDIFAPRIPPGFDVTQWFLHDFRCLEIDGENVFGGGSCSYGYF